MTGDRASGSAKAPSTSDTDLENVRADAARLRRQLVKCRRHADEQARCHTLDRDELQHRARNTIALIRSAFRRTVETGLSLEDVEMHFCGRLDVLAHYMLPHSGRRGAMVDVQDLIRNELRNFQFGDAPGITINGNDAALSLEQAQPFALMIHELATNALKYGALSRPNAALSVSWEIDDGRLKLVWAETGVPLVLPAPVPRGFGQEFIEEALPYQTGATTRFERKPGGVRCTIELPLAGSHQDHSFVKEEEA